MGSKRGREREKCKTGGITGCFSHISLMSIA